ncbi:MAG: glycosyltransferase family 39 protein [Propionivibrio sp.]|uniref:ArnT family glycosyltransferase n=1 Tax=Propionivibrio sp. TaxID=2212460 RepID=UPI0025F2B9E9|nr:glycosyltransferase family 39 protein [Propionivibrio sp.]MBK8893857.1 glycosyltransferase family 39 protein [Propionivibrio sp.]
MTCAHSPLLKNLLARADKLIHYAWLAPVFLVLLNAFLTLPEVLMQRLYPWDDALYAANGIFFLTLFQNLPAVIADPMTWMTEYYHQYPALFVRRQPPLFGVVESGIYAAFGPSPVTAKLTVFLFSTLFVVGWYFALRAWTRRTSIAFLATLLTVTLPMTVQQSTAIRPDIPALTLFVWALYWFRTYQDSLQGRRMYALLIAATLAGSLYTYQLPMFGVVALFVYWIVTDWPAILKRGDAYLLTGTFTLLMIPLVVFTLKFAFDNVAGVVGPTVKDFEVFVPVDSKSDPRYWLHYLGMAWDIYRLPTLGLILWAVTRFRNPVKNWEVFFVISILTAYFGYSVFPSKGDRYAYYFVLPMLPLAAAAIVDLWGWAARSRPIVRLLPLCIIGAAVTWNVIGIPGARSPQVTGFDGVAREIVSTFGSGNALYHGRFESAFIYYLRKEDPARQFRVLRSGNEITDPANLGSALDKQGIDLVLMQGQITQKGNGYPEIYQPLFTKLSDLLASPDSPYRLWREFKIKYGAPGAENDVLLQVFVRQNLHGKK